MQNMNWGDYEYFLAVARSGSALAASRKLGVNHTTISRRVAALELSLGCRLFEKSKTGYRMTEEGEAIYESVEAIELNVQEIAKRTLGRVHQAVGTVTVTTSEVIYANLVAPFLRQFCTSYPRISLNFQLSDNVEDLNQRSVDIALRFTHTPSENLVGSQLCQFTYSVYRSAEEESECDGWVMWSHEEGIPPRLGRFSIPQNRILGVTSMSAKQTAIRTGIGAGELPCFVGDNDPQLRRISDPVQFPEAQLWLLTHKDIVRTQRIKLVMDFLRECIGNQKGLITGERGA